MCSNESCSKCLWKTPATQRIVVFVISNVSNNSRCLGLTQGKAPSCSSLSCPIPSCLWMCHPLKLGILKQFYSLGLACEVIQSCVFLFAFQGKAQILSSWYRENDFTVNSHPVEIPTMSLQCFFLINIRKIANQRCGILKALTHKKTKKKRTVCVSARRKSKHQALINHLIYNPSKKLWAFYN